MDKIDCLSAILTLSERMLVAARKSDWEAVEVLEVEQRALGRQLTSLPLPNSDSTGARQRQLIEETLLNHAAIFAVAAPLHRDLEMLLKDFAEAPKNER